MLVTKAKYELGQRVFLSTDVDQRERIVVGILIRQTGLQFELICGNQSSWHYDFEIAIEKDMVKAINP